MKFIILLATISCSSYEYEGNHRKAAPPYANESMPYLADTEITDAKYTEFKKAVCGEITDKKCKTEFYKQFIKKMTQWYLVTVKQISNYCEGNQVECTRPRELESFCRQQHNMAIKQMEYESELRSAENYQTNQANGFQAMSNAFGNISNNIMSQPKPVRCQSYYVGSILQTNCN